MRADDRVSTEGVKMNSLGEHARDLRRCDHCRQRAAIADPFGHGHNIRNHVLRLKSPIVGAGAPESGLNFVRNANTPGGTRVFVSGLQIAVRENHAAAHSLDRFRDEGGDLSRCRVVNQAFHIGCIMLAGIRIVATPWTAVRIGGHGVMNAKAVRHVKFPGAVRS